MNAILNPAWATVRERLTRTYRGLPPDRPPLQIACSGQGGLSMPSFTASLADPEMLLRQQLEEAWLVKAIGSDSIPVLVPVPNSAVLVPAMYGAEIVEKESVWARPLSGDLDDIVSRLELPALDAGLMPAYERNVRFFVDRAPDWAHVCSPIAHEALESANYLRGTRLYTEMIDQPERVQQLLAALTQTHIETTARIKTIVGEPADCMVSHKGTFLPATRLACDSIVNLSTAMIRAFFSPHLERLASTLGTSVHLHWCSIRTNPARHVPVALAPCRAISGLATMHHCFGDSNDPPDLQASLKGRYALTVDLPARDSRQEFARWAQELAQRWQTPSSVIIRILVTSVDEGRARMDAWREAWGVE